MKSRCFVLVLLVAAYISIPVLGGVVPGRWEKVEALEPGSGILISLNSGEKLNCFIQGTTADAVNATGSDGVNHTFPKEAVSKIETLEKERGPLWDGPLIGGAIGLAVSGILVGAYGDAGENAGALVFGGAVGAGVGLALDAAVAGRKTLYKAK